MKTLALLTLTAALALTGCATTPHPASKPQPVTTAVLRDVGDAAFRVAISTLTDAATGEKIDLAHAAAEGLWESAATVATAGDVQKIVESWSGGALKSVATDLARQFAAVAPQTASDRSALAQALATGLSAAAFTATGLP